MVSCEEIIDVDLKTSEPALVAEATILLDSLAGVKLAYTSGYFDTAGAEPEAGATLVSITDDSGRSEMLEYLGKGVYNYFNLVNDVLFSAMSSSTPFNPESNISGGILGYFMAASFDSDSIIIY